MSDNLQNVVDQIDTDAIRNGDSLALVDALTRIHRGLNDSITQLAQLRQQAAIAPLYCRLYRHLTAQSIPDDTDTYLLWETPPSPGDMLNGVNIGGMFDPAESASNVLLREPGLYLIEAYVRWDTNVTGDRRMNVDLLGSLDSIVRDRQPASITASEGLRQKVTTVVPWKGLTNLATGSVWNGRIAVQVYQNSGGARTVSGAGVFYDHWFGVTRIGAIR